MTKVHSLASSWGVLRALAFTAVAMVAAAWVAPSTAAAQPMRYCLATDRDVNPGEQYYCVHEEIGMLASLTVIASNWVSISVRQLEGYACEARAYNDLGSLIGLIGPLTYEDEVVEDCFRQSDECYDISPVAMINFLCWQT